VGALPPLKPPAAPDVAPPPVASPVAPPTAEATSPVAPPVKPSLTPSLSPAAAATAQKLTETMDQRTQRLGFELSAQQPTNPMYPMWKKAVEEDLARIPNLKSEATREEIKSMGKEYAGIQALGRVSAELHNIGEQAQAIMSRPDFERSTGFGAETKLLANRLLVSLGVKDADGASSAEIFNKLFSEALQGRIEAAKADAAELGPAGRQYLTQLNIMAKASPNIENTYETNKYLVTQMMRQSLKHMGIANAATEYASKNEFQSLDKGWNPIHIKMLKEGDFSPTEQRTIIAKEKMGPEAPPRLPFPTAHPESGEKIGKEDIKRETNFATGRERFIDKRNGKVILERPMYGG
jgi:ribosomal protein S17E